MAGSLQRAGITAACTFGCIIVLWVYHGPKTVLEVSQPVTGNKKVPSFFKGGNVDAYELQQVQFCNNLTSCRDNGREFIATRWEDMVDKWFWDIEFRSNIRKGTRNCNRIMERGGSRRSGYLKSYTSSRASFLYAFKSASRKQRMEGYSAQVNSQTWIYHLMARKNHVQTVCETGFNGGHSSYMWLSSHPSSRVMSFDLGNHKYAHTMSRYLMAKYPGRLNVTFGNSVTKLPAFKEYLRTVEPGFKCDIIVVDGGHTYPVCKADMNNFRSLAIPGHSLLVLDDYPSKMFPFGSLGRIWEEQKKSKEIAEIFRCTLGRRGFSVGYFL